MCVDICIACGPTPGLHCDLVAPSSVPSPRGKAVKTDRIDAGHLAQFYPNELLTIVRPPDAEQEQGRDALRTRQLMSWIDMDVREYSSAGKHPNKVKVACAREIVGFVWKSLNAVAA